MGKKRYTPEQIIRLLREVEVLVSQGLITPEPVPQAGSLVNTTNVVLDNQENDCSLQVIHPKKAIFHMRI